MLCPTWDFGLWLARGFRCDLGVTYTSGVSAMRHTGLLTSPSLLERPAFFALAMALVLVVPACREDAAPGADEVESQIAAAVDEQLGGLSDADQVRVIVAARDGEVVYERYTGTTPEEWQDIASMTKSVLSTLVGIAVADGLLSLDDTLAEALPTYAGQMKPAVSKVTLRHLLTMSGGFPDDVTFIESHDPVAASLAAGSGATGDFIYAEPDVHVLSAVLMEAAGMSVLDYARKELFDPLGIDTRPALETRSAKKFEAADFAWVADPQGVHQGGFWMKLRPEDMLKLGQLYLDEGVWEGERIVPAAWVQDATTRQVIAAGQNSHLPDYGYLWWVGEMDGERAFAAIGIGGQRVLVVPDRRLVVVTSVEIPVATDLPSHSLGTVMDYVVESTVVSAFGPSE
jgi:CubicO group peptidase (beta-lactamase class C family)